MKKLFGVFLLLVFGVFLASTALADESYTVDVINGQVWASAGGVSGLPGTVPTTSVVNLDILYDPFTTVGTIDQLATAPLPTGNWNAAGWWEFAVTGSSGSGWNDVFGGGNYNFTSDWSGSLNFVPISVHFGELNTTFDAIYGKWSKNNDSVYTYMGLYFPPNTGPASAGTSPTGIFAFVADDPLLYPSGFDLGGLYQLTGGNATDVNRGTGIFTATAVPEPTTFLLLGLGLAGIAGLKLRKRA